MGLFARLAPLVLLAACSHAEGTPSDLRAQLAAHRAVQIERLHAYAEAGQFPHDYTIAPSLHMFRDADGRLCAVANLVYRDGVDDLVESTVKSDNAIAVADVKEGPMLDWILGSGLTQEELARIQLPAPVLMPQQAAVGEAMSEAQMIAMVRAHVAAVEAELRSGEARSLDLAVARYQAAKRKS